MTVAIGRLQLTIAVAPAVTRTRATPEPVEQVSRVERLYRQDKRLSAANADRARWASMPSMGSSWGR